MDVKIYKSFEYFNIRRFFPTLVIVSLRFLILCNNDFGVIVKIVINENGNYFFVAQKQPPFQKQWLHMKIVLCMQERVESGSVHFWCNFLGTKKSTRLKINSLQTIQSGERGIGSMRSPIPLLLNLQEIFPICGLPHFYYDKWALANLFADTHLTQ